ncbi:exodeoxyribonuclease-5 [Azospirillum brasilense]|uniref:Exodeoxyribonuclease-5 n=1 Tax=Azospirillum brasilense TaxID=192 RepID=A0A560BN72_AZOBR|nr:ATP-dependent RecD-like DNA helicase [Azospirillum brasilense]TWA73969.1 exodeoxyribonuclease-5 [Azospirillum brasilense]
MTAMKTGNITPSAAQLAVIRQIVEWYGERGRQEFYLAGYAGVGKTTIAALAIEEIQRRYKGCRKVITGAYTGKAAHRLRQKGAPDPSTIHAMIYLPKVVEGRLVFELAADGPASSADLIVLDEVSMVNRELASDLRSFGKKILVMGDPGQLPPVAGAGAFTNREPDAFLSEIHRQAADSPIIRLATAARLGEPIRTGDYGADVRVAVLTQETQHEVYQPRTQAICGIHRVRWTICQRARRRFGFEGPLPLKGEKLICTRNNREEGLFNGALGIATADAEPEVRPYVDIRVHLDDEPEPRNPLLTHPWQFAQHFDASTRKPDRLEKGINEFDWAYAITCHKAQGSEWPHVTIVDDSAAFRRAGQNDAPKWLYTAITRAQAGLTLLLRGA